MSILKHSAVPTQPSHHHLEHAGRGYYVPASSPWPIVGACGLFFFMIGAANLLHGNVIGVYAFCAGIMVLLIMFVGWFRIVIDESLAGLHNQQMDRSYRWGMFWFIVSEVFFFLAFFGALFYIRTFAMQWLVGNGGSKSMTGLVLWPNFQAVWPILQNPSAMIKGPLAVIHPDGIPLLNTFLLLTSSVTITIAHHALKDNKPNRVLIGVALTIILGLTFLTFQVREYYEAYTELGLTLASGIYGSTFFMLTGFHGMHVTLGSIMLIVILVRCYKQHFTPEHHFAFEAVSWYWHFVDVVWLGLFIFVYLL